MSSLLPRRPRARLRAQILAAGLGSRLRPLTENLPKPLLPVMGRPLVELTLDRLYEIGCEGVAINLHYQGEKIRAALGASYRGMPLVYSEEPELLGTLGALAPTGEFLRQAETVLLINGDSLCDWPLQDLLHQHEKYGCRATLLLSKDADPDRFGGGVGVGQRGNIVSFREGGPEAGVAVHRWVFAGAHALTTALLADLDERPSDIVTDLYEPMIMAGEALRAVGTSRPWHDLGTPARYLNGLRDWMQRGAGSPAWGSGSDAWLAPDVALAAGVEVTGSVVEAGCRLEAGARLVDSLVMAGSSIGEGSQLSESIIDFGVDLPPTSVVHRRLVTPLRPSRAAAPGDTVVGDLVYRAL